MTPAEVRGFLATNNVGVLSAPDGSGLVTRTVAYRLSGDDILIDAADLPSGPGVCMLVDTYPDYDHIKGIILHGTLTPVVNGVRKLEISHASGFDFSKMAVP